MSRVGKVPIAVPEGVEVAIDGRKVAVTGHKGTCHHELPKAITVRSEDGMLHFERADDSISSKSLHGLSRSLVNNMIIGVSQGFMKDLRIHGVGYRVVESGPQSLTLELGFSHRVNISAPDGVEFDVPQRTQILVKGIDKQLVGQVAADIRKWRKPEPYKGKGIRYANEHVRRKAGKQAK